MQYNYFVLTLLAACSLSAQTAARLSGTVHDPSGKAISGARVIALQPATGLTRATETASNGAFAFGDLPPTSYQLKVEKTGFRPLLRDGIHLNVGDAVNIDVTLEVGALEQQVTVVERASMVNTTNAELGFLVGEEAMRELPMNGRNYTDLALLQPGVTPFPNRDGGSVVAHGLAMSINGQDPRSNVYLLDGTLQNDFTNGPAGSAASTVLGLEGIREFRVVMNNYAAEFGRNSGGQFHALTKSGANDLHGALYYFHRNDNLDARNFFDPEKQPDFKRNQFGGSLGGAIAKNKTFYFLTYEALRERLGRTITTVVPDDNARKGILPDPNNPGGAITVPINPSVVPYLNEYPVANGPSRGGGLANYYFGFNQALRQDFGQGRIDHYFSDRHQSFARYTIDDADQHLPTDYPQFPRSFLSRNMFLTLEHRWVQSARTSHTFRGSFSRTKIRQAVESNTVSTVSPFIIGRDLVGNIDIGGFPRWGPQTSVTVRLTQNVFGGEYQWVHFRGKHLWKAGILAEHYQNNMVNPTFSLGIHTFTNLRTFLAGTPQRFLGLPASGALDRYWRFNLMGFYLQDDWKVSSRLTLNLGLRYEFASMPVDIYGRDSSLRNLETDTQPTVGPLYQNPTYTNLMPRFSFAYDLTGNGRTSLRGGYGLFFNTNNQQHLIVTVTNPPATPRVSVTNAAFPVPNLGAGVANTMRPVQWDIASPYVQFYNLSLQRQFWGDVLVSAGFIGSRGQRLWRSGDWNIATPTREADGTLLFPVAPRRRNPAFGVIELKSSDGDSWYNAGILEIRKRFGKGFTAQSSYTFARNIDTTQASTFFSDSTSGTTTAFPEFEGFNYNKGLADYHAKHTWVANFIWLTPGRSAWVKDWQFSGIWSMRSGNPLTPFVTANRSRSLWAPSQGPGIGFDRPSFAPGATHESAILGRPDKWFNDAAFVLQRAGTFGNAGRGTLIGPDLRTLDLALMRTFPLTRWKESAGLQLRLETFNLFNRANFGPPQLTVFSGQADNEAALSSFGQVRATVTSARQIQLGLRFNF